MNEVFAEVDAEQCPECKFMGKCPARKILKTHPDDSMVQPFFRTGRCSQFRTRRKNKDDNHEDLGE